MFPGKRSLRRRIAVISSCATTWGGSEELWAVAAERLARKGHRVVVYKHFVDDAHRRVRQLRASSCRVVDIGGIPLVPAGVRRFFARAFYPVSVAAEGLLLLARLWVNRPDLAVISQGANADGWVFAHVCRILSIPYVVIAQKATETYWPGDDRVEYVRAMYASARRSLFVSEHNLRLTQDQIGAALPNARIVRNPFLVSWEGRPDWPSEDDGLQLACVGRLCPSEKGQDILLRVLAREKWRRRDVTVTFYGEGTHRRVLETLAERLEVTNAIFAGHTADVNEIWGRSHGLVLPSRSEGLPLVVIEAMLSGRVAIVTDVAGNREVIEDGVSGFLAPTADESALDAALERAWSRRAEWRTIGQAAAERARTVVPRDPAGELSDLVERLVSSPASEGMEGVTADVRSLQDESRGIR